MKDTAELQEGNGETSQKEVPFVVAIASSAGGLFALREIVTALPQDFPAPITIVQHMSPDQPSHLADILAHHTALNVKQAKSGDVLASGNVYVAPPDWHLQIAPGGILNLSHDDRQHFVRPSADVLFESLASSLGERAIAVVLTGTGVDGARGVQIVKAKGGKVIAQDEATSEFFGMPGAAIQTGIVDFIVPLGDIAPLLVSLVTARKQD